MTKTHNFIILFRETIVDYADKNTLGGINAKFLMLKQVVKLVTTEF
jgi:hypothetical protein